MDEEEYERFKTMKKREIAEQVVQLEKANSKLTGELNKSKDHWRGIWEILKIASLFDSNFVLTLRQGLRVKVSDLYNRITRTKVD